MIKMRGFDLIFIGEFFKVMVDFSKINFFEYPIAFSKITISAALFDDLGVTFQDQWAFFIKIIPNFLMIKVTFFQDIDGHFF